MKVPSLHPRVGPQESILGQMKYDVVKVDWPTWGERIGRLRAKVWLDLAALRETDLQNGLLTDRFDPEGYHFAVVDGESVLGAGRLSVGSSDSLLYGAMIRKYAGDCNWPSAELMRLVVHPDYRGRKFATMIDEERIRTAVNLGASDVFGMTFTRPKMLLARGFEIVMTVPADQYRELNCYSPTDECYFLRLRLSRHRGEV